MSRRRAGCGRSSPAASMPRQYLARTSPTTQGVGGEVVRTGEAQLVQDALADERVAHFDGLGPQAGALIVRAAAQRRGRPGRADYSSGSDADARFSRRGVRAGPALRRPRLDRAAQRRGPPRGRAARRDRRADRAQEPRHADRAHRASWSTQRRPVRDADGRPRLLQDVQRPARPRGRQRRCCARSPRRCATSCRDSRRGLPLRRRRVRAAAARRRASPARAIVAEKIRARRRSS